MIEKQGIIYFTSRVPRLEISSHEINIHQRIILTYKLTLKYFSTGRVASKLSHKRLHAFCKYNRSNTFKAFRVQYVQ